RSERRGFSPPCRTAETSPAARSTRDNHPENALIATTRQVGGLPDLDLAVEARRDEGGPVGGEGDARDAARGPAHCGPVLPRPPPPEPTGGPPGRRPPPRPPAVGPPTPGSSPPPPAPQPRTAPSRPADASRSPPGLNRTASTPPV